MAYAEVAPPATLRSLVECAWVATGSSHERRVLPDGCIDILAIGGTRAFVVGTMTRAIVVPPGRRVTVGIRFRPGEAFRLVPGASCELTDERTPLAEHWGRAASPLEDTLLERLEGLSTASVEDALASTAPLLFDAIATRLASHGDSVDLRVRAGVAILTRGRSVADTASQVDLSVRQFSRRFEARVGVSPKVFARVMRLQEAVRHISEGASLSTAAQRAGYADQAHFTRDSTDLAGRAPATSDSFKT